MTALHGSIGVLLAVAASVAFAQTTSEDFLREGLNHLAADRPEAALESISQAAAIAPRDGRVRLALAEVYRSLDRDAEAEEHLTAVGEIAQREPFLLRGLSVYYEKGGEPSQAAFWEGRYAQLFPNHISAFGRAAALHLAAGDTRAAIEFAKSGLEREQRADLYDLLGKAYAEAGQDEAAEEAFRETIRLEPYDEEYRYNLGYLHLRAQRFEQALAAFDEGLKVFDKSPRIELGRATAYYGLRRFDEALDCTLKAAELAPGAPQPHYFLSRMLEHAGDRMEEIVARQKSFAEANPNVYLGHFVHAQAWLRSLPPGGDKGVEKQAEALLRRSIALRGDFGEAHFELGELLARQRRYEAAETALKRAVELNPDASKPRYRLARVYDRLGKTELAAAERKRHAELTEEERRKLGDMGALDNALGGSL